jgi:hypothetical protein
MARQIDLGEISQLAEDELEELVVFAAKVWEGQVKEKTPVDTGILKGNWRQVKISKTRIEIQNNKVYAEPVVYGNNLPPSWGGLYRTRQNPPTIPGYPDLLAKEIAAFQIPAKIELIRRKNR